jgi:hypothetical protein
MAVVDQVTIPGVPKVITAEKHAVLDYSVAATFFLMGARFMSRHRRAATLAFLNGGMVLAASIFTNYPGGVWRKMSFPMHGVMDIGQAAFAGFGPMLMGFGRDPEARVFYGQALSEVGVIAATDWTSAPVGEARAVA